MPARYFPPLTGDIQLPIVKPELIDQQLIRIEYATLRTTASALS